MVAVLVQFVDSAFRCELSKSQSISTQEQLESLFLTQSLIKCAICDSSAVQKVTLIRTKFVWGTIPDDPYNYSEHNLCNKRITDKRYKWFLFIAVLIVSLRATTVPILFNTTREAQQAGPREKV